MEALEAQQDIGHQVLFHHQHQADTVVEGAHHLFEGNFALLLEKGENRGHGPGVPVNHRPAGLGEDAGQVVREAAAGDVADAAQGKIPPEIEHGLHIDAGGLE